VSPPPIVPPTPIAVHAWGFGAAVEPQPAATVRPNVSVRVVSVIRQGVFFPIWP
jgi:hypothetical protein